MNKSINVFFSWQSDRGTAEQNVVEAALERAFQKIAVDPAIEVAVREGLSIDKDTQGVGGTPKIVDTIFEKIDHAAIFVADLTFVATRVGGTPSPNPNVLIEYGWTLNSLGYTRIISVMNTHHGSPTPATMPFDMRHLRFPIGFDLPQQAEEPLKEVTIEALSKKLEEQLRLIIAQSDLLTSDPAGSEFPGVDAALRFRVAGPVGKTFDILGVGSRDVRLKDGPVYWLNLPAFANLYQSCARATAQGGRRRRRGSQHDQD